MRDEETKKGISNLFVVLLLILISISLAISFFSFGRDIVEGMKSPSEQKAEETISKYGTSFYIYNVTENVVMIKNNGQTIIPADKFVVYLNDTIVSATNDSPYVAPGEILNLTLSRNTNGYIVTVTGPFEENDELPGPPPTTTTSTSTTTSILYIVCDINCKTYCGYNWYGVCEKAAGHSYIACDPVVCHSGCSIGKIGCLPNNCVCYSSGSPITSCNVDSPYDVVSTPFPVNGWGYTDWGDCSGSDGGWDAVNRYCRCKGYIGAMPPISKPCYNQYKSKRYKWNTYFCPPTKGSHKWGGYALTKVKCCKAI